MQLKSGLEVMTLLVGIHAMCMLVTKVYLKSCAYDMPAWLCGHKCLSVKVSQANDRRLEFLSLKCPLILISPKTQQARYIGTYIVYQ